MRISDMMRGRRETYVEANNEYKMWCVKHDDEQSHITQMWKSMKIM